MMMVTKIIIVGLALCIFGLLFGVTGSLITKKFTAQEKFIDFGGKMLSTGIIILVLAWIYWVGTLLMG